MPYHAEAGLVSYMVLGMDELAHLADVNKSWDRYKSFPPDLLIGSQAVAEPSVLLCSIPTTLGTSVLKER